MTTTNRPDDFTDAQRAGLGARQAHQDRTLASVHQLEAVLGSAAPGREEQWRSAVLDALRALEEATADESRNAEAPDSLLSDLARTQPWLRNRVRAVRLQYRQLRDHLASLEQELAEHPGQPLDYSDIRQRLSWVLTGLRNQRARESDLIYEAYFDAFHTDLAPETGPADPEGPDR
ncbi:MAG TPA: hypothetical protein VFP54_04755 [Acidimicrobiales bacterium]|nr:hypothetical protein [Acidimicrobiales bacterium]